jgi:hypothetical protein
MRRLWLSRTQLEQTPDEKIKCGRNHQTYDNELTDGVEKVPEGIAAKSFRAWETNQKAASNERGLLILEE